MGRKRAGPAKTFRRSKAGSHGDQKPRKKRRNLRTPLERSFDAVESNIARGNTRAAGGAAKAFRRAAKSEHLDLKTAVKRAKKARSTRKKAARRR